MDKVTYTVENQRKIERFLLVIYGIYSLAMFTVAVRQNWNDWIVFLMLGALAANMMIHVGKYKDYLFRAKFSAIMMQGSMILCATQMGKITYLIPVFMVFVVLLGLYGIENIIYTTVVSIVLIFFYHGVIVQSIPFSTVEEMGGAVLQFCNVLLLENVVYSWTKRNREGSIQLLEAIEELKTAESSKNDFLANVSHEIRTPLNTICGMSELVLREEVPLKIRDNMLNIQIAGRNLMGVVRDILDFSELQSGKMELEEEAYNITSTINDVINMTMARKNEKNLELIVDCDANIPSALLGDEKKLRRVIMNLVDNAIKFTEEGFVSITIGCRRESYGINLIVTVKDTGIGMDEEHLEKLFTTFNQVDASRKRQEGGIGLGLAISQALVQKMGGALTVKSRLGKGSIVKFVVPQKILDETPIASIRNKERVNVATYIDMEQFDMVAIRDEYTGNIVHMVEQLKAKCHICRNLAELQRREEKEKFSHIFISMVEYREAPSYFDRLSEQTQVIVVLDPREEKDVTNPGLLKIYKPFYIMTIVSVLNGLYGEQGEKHPVYTEKFVTRDAHVLVVDDNWMNIKVIEGLLANYCIRTTVATSGKEALDKIASADYDFVFMDHMMPDMDGVETLHRIRNKVGTYYRKVPVIALTANAVAGTREKLLAEGFTDFVEKPVERSVLERVLRRNLPADKIIAKDTEEAVECSELVIEGLDVGKGILYCNGEEQYIKILREYCSERGNSDVLAEQLFQKKDWDNYTIVVHGIKSAMHSIGAMKVAEAARQLELAGKEGRTDYILQHHDEMRTEYRRVLSNIRENPIVCPHVQDREDVKGQQTGRFRKDGQQESEKKVLGDDVLEQKLAALETAMYALDGEALLKIISELEEYQYHGIVLKTYLVPVRRRIEMTDYMSAVEMVEQLKDKPMDREGRQHGE